MKQRDWLVDIVRVASVIIVVTMHWTYARVTWENGAIVTTNAYVGPVWRIATWALMAMPAFFVCGGFSNTVVWDRCRSKKQDYGTYLGLRARRLVSPAIPLLIIIVGISLAARGISPAIGRMVGKQTGNVLWFLAVYLVCVMLAPLQVWLHDHIGSWIPFGVAMLIGAVSLELYHRGVPLDLTYLMFLMWPACHQLGVAYARGALDRVPTWGLALMVVASAATITALIAWAGYAPNSIGLRGDNRENIIPPTVAMGLLGLAQYAALTWGSRKLQGWAPPERVQRGLGAVTALLMPIYLWHLPTLLVLTGIGMAFPTLLVQGWGLWWLTRPLFFLVGFLVLAGIVMLAAKWELFMQRLQARTATVPVLIGSLMATAGIYYVWRYGISWEPRNLGATGLVVASLPLLTTFTRHQPPSAS